MAVRQAALGNALARPKPEPAAVGKGFHRGIDLKGVAGGRIHKAFDAARDVRHQQIGAEQAGAGGARQSQHPDHPHARDEEQRAPHHQDQHGLAEIRLHHQQRHQHQQQHHRHRGRRHFRALGRFRKQPGRDDDEGGLCGFRGLDVDADQRDPAPRALHFRSEQECRHDQRDAHEKHDQRGAADLLGRQEGDADQHDDGGQQEQHVAAEEVKGIEPDAGRHRRARRQRQDDAGQHQRQDRGQQRLVDGPPPFGQRRAFFAGEH